MLQPTSTPNKVPQMRFVYPPRLRFLGHQQAMILDRVCSGGARSPWGLLVPLARPTGLLSANSYSCPGAREGPGQPPPGAQSAPVTRHAPFGMGPDCSFAGKISCLHPAHLLQLACSMPCIFRCDPLNIACLKSGGGGGSTTSQSRPVYLCYPVGCDAAPQAPKSILRSPRIPLPVESRCSRP